MRYQQKVKPTVGTVIGGIWTYVLVTISKDSSKKGTYNIFESSKYKTIEQAREALDGWREHDREYARDNGRAPGKPEYFLAEWKQVDGKCVCVLMDDPLLATL